jgi:hypothetical protein
MEELYVQEISSPYMLYRVLPLAGYLTSAVTHLPPFQDLKKKILQFPPLQP